MNPSLASLRRRLTAWYVGVFTLVLLVMGVSLLAVLTRQVSVRLDRSLESAAAEVIRAAEIRERERGLPAGAAVDAFEELRIPGRMLFVFDAQAAPVHPSEVPDWIGPGVREALATGTAWERIETGGDRSYRFHARRFDLPGVGRFVAVAAADIVEVEEEYASLIVAFGLAGIVAIVLAALGGAALARRSTRPVEQAFAQMQRFMADAAHELRTPLTILHGRADVTLQRSRSPAEYEEALTTIRNETARMNALVERLLQLGRAGSADERIHREPLFVDDALVEAGEEVSITARERGVRLNIGTLDETPFTGDAYLIRQMFRNILDNAVRHSPPGGAVTVSILCSNGTAIATIEDQGAGIPPDELPHVFEPFYRSDLARGRSGGAGLGLAIAHSVAKAHGVRIDIESEPGTGTSVRITFPM